MTTTSKAEEARSAWQRALSIIKKSCAKKSDMAVAARIGVTRQAMARWDAVPPQRVHIVSQLTGIAPHRLRPDLPLMFPRPKKEKAA